MKYGILWGQKNWVLEGLGSWQTSTCRRDVSTFKKRDDNVKHLKNCTFFTDHWDAFSNVLPKDRHVIGKKHTVFIERHNSSTMNGSGRMTSRTTIVSKKGRGSMAQLSFGRPLRRPRSLLMIKRYFYLCLGENSQNGYFYDVFMSAP